MSTFAFFEELEELLDKYDVEIEIDLSNSVANSDIEIYIKSTGDMFTVDRLDVDSVYTIVQTLKTEHINQD